LEPFGRGQIETGHLGLPIVATRAVAREERAHLLLEKLDRISGSGSRRL
jgi:hypothetical protein